MSFLDSLWNYLLLSTPYLWLGMIFSGLIHGFLSVEMVKKWLGNKRKRDVLLAAAIGVPLPLCSCSVIPTAVTLKKSGASNAATSAFLISTPESGVDSLFVTYGMFDLPMTLFRPLAAFTSAFVAGGLQLVFNPDKPDDEVETEEKSCCAHNKKTSVINLKLSFKEKVLKGLKFSVNDLINDLALWLSVGLVVGAMLSYFIPNDFFEQFSGWQLRGMIILIGVPFYICASASTPIALSMVLKGLSPGAALLLLLVGPATNIANVLVLQKAIGKKGVVINVISIVFVALIFSFFADWFYQSIMPLKLNGSGHFHDHHQASWWEILSVITFIPLLLRGLWREEIKPKFFSSSKHLGHHHP